MVPYLVFYIILIFIFVPGLSVSMCTLKITQPLELIHGRFNQSITIPCQVNTTCPKNMPNVLWYVFRTNSYYQLDTNNQQMKYTLNVADLHIACLSHNDDGVYHCAASDDGSTNSGAQAIGSGTTLTLEENGYNAGQVLLLTLVVLLSLYSLLILILFISIKTGRATLFKRRPSRSKEGDSTRRVHFGAVVQELYNVRNLRRNKKNTSTEVSQENKVETPQSHTEKEDVYQNLKRAS